MKLGSRLMKIAAITIIGLFILTYILPLGVRPLVIPDETRYAEISREMMESGDWVVPHLNGIRYFEKPVLGYWIHAVSIKLLGENAFALRLPSALAAGFSAWMLFFLVRRFAGGPAALLASTVFLTCVEVFMFGVFCVLDSLFSLLVTASVISFFLACMAPNPRARLAYLIGCGIFCGLAFLTKGFLSIVLLLLTIVPFMLWEHRWKDLIKSLWIPLVFAILMVLPWGIMIYRRENDFWHYFLWEEHIQRFLSSHAQHARPFWFFIPILLAGVFPWTPLIPLTIDGLKKRFREIPFLRFSLCWLVFPFLFFSICRGKLGSYIVPCFPPFAILMAVGLLQYSPTAKTKAFNRILSGSVILIITGSVLFTGIQLFLPRLRIYGQDETWKWILIIIGLVFYAFFLKGARKPNYRTKLVLCCIGPVFLMLIAHFATPDRFKSGKMPEEFLLKYQHRIQPHTILVSDNYLTPAVCWFYQRDDVYIINRKGEFAYGIDYEDADHKFIAIKEFPDFIKQNCKGRNIVLITSEKRYNNYHKLSLIPANEVREYGFVMAEYSSTMAADQTFATSPTEKEICGLH